MPCCVTHAISSSLLFSLTEWSSPSSFWKLLQSPIPTSSSRKPSLKLHAFLWTSRIRSKFRCPLRLIVSFGKLLAQQVLVTPLKNRLMWHPIVVCCSFITRPFPYRIVHCYIVTSRAPPFINIKSVSGAHSHGLAYSTISGLDRPPHYIACGSATSLLKICQQKIYFIFNHVMAAAWSRCPLGLSLLGEHITCCNNQFMHLNFPLDHKFLEAR